MVSVERVLPWRRVETARAPEVGPLVAPFKGRQAKAEAALVTRAYGLAASKHAGQVRRSGEAYLSHPLAVARIVAEQTQDPVAIAAALLHDVVEDTDIGLDDLRRQFPPAVAEIVDGVTKVERTLFATKEAQQAATMRKLVIAMADDLRVLIIKLADRLHNMRTLAAMPIEKQQAIARETFDVYAPLALRLGMDDVRTQLEDLAFAALHPKWYAEIDEMVWSRTPEREVYLTQVAEEVRMRLEDVGITAEVTGRPKHLWSIYEKMVIKGREFSEIFDLVGIRVVVGTIKDCYAAVGSTHQMWMPVQGRFKDYIAMPKYNTYQSLHTTVVGPQGKQLEVQIRTREMDLRASFGVAAHWRYKAEPEELEWLDRMIEWQSDVSDPSEFMASLKGDLDQDEVVAFTPKGEVVHLPTGATPVDFAYAIHTQIGHKCIGAKVDGSLVELSTPLRSGQTVEIFTAKTDDAGPSPDWLEWVASPKAASKIRQWLAQQRRDSVLEVGQEELEKELRVRGLPLAEVAQSGAVLRAAVELNYADLDALYRAVGERHVSATRRRRTRAARAGGGRARSRDPPDVLRPRAPPPGEHPQHHRCARRGHGRRAGAAGPLLHAGAARPDHGLPHAGPGRLRPPGRLRQRGLARRGPPGPPRRCGVGHRRRQQLPGVGRGSGARPHQAAAGRGRGALRPPHQHRGVPDPDRRRPGLPDALRVRGQRSVPARRRHGDDPGARGRLQHGPGPSTGGHRAGARASTARRGRRRRRRRTSRPRP